MVLMSAILPRISKRMSKRTLKQVLKQRMKQLEKQKIAQIVLTPRPFYYPLMLLTTLLIAASLAACTQVPAALALMQDYQARLARVQELDVQPLSAPSAPQIPSVRSLTQQQPPVVALSMLDAMRLDACKAGQLLAERNSALGKLGSGLLRYQQSLALIDALQQCITQDSDANLSPATKTRLQQAIAAQQSHLNALRQHAMATDSSLRHALSPGSKVLEEMSNAALAPSIEALTVVSQLLAYQPATVTQTDALPSVKRLQQALQNLEQSDYLPQLWRTLHDQQHWLAQLEPYVTDAARNAACQNGKGSSKADILHTVFVKFYSSEIQPELASLSSQSYALRPVLNRLTELSSQPTFRAHLLKLQVLPQGLTDTTKKHAQHWQAFFKACGFQPGESSEKTQ